MTSYRVLPFHASEFTCLGGMDTALLSTVKEVRDWKTFLFLSIFLFFFLKS